MNLKQKITKVRKEHEIKINEEINNILKAELNVEEISLKSNAIKINNYIISKINIDQYNNLYCTFNSIIPIEVLTKFRIIIQEFWERENSYKGRTGTHLFIEYFEKFYKKLSINDLKQMIAIDEEQKVDKNGFKEWLIGNSYCTGGNLKRYNPKINYNELL